MKTFKLELCGADMLALLLVVDSYVEMVMPVIGEDPILISHVSKLHRNLMHQITMKMDSDDLAQARIDLDREIKM